MQNRRILISLAHPDDESFGSGGLIAKYIAEGAEVYLICATNGDVGTISPELLNGYSSHAELRLAELDCAAKVLGLTEVFLLGYKDSGMMGSKDNQDPNCLWYNWNHNPDAVIQRVVEVMRKIKPQVVITFNKYGGYGHPDHIAIQQATLQAFEIAGSSDYLTGDLAPYQPQKLYYSSIPTAMIRYGIWQARLRRQNPRKLGRNNDIDLVAILDHVEPAHTLIDVSQYLEQWAEANACHASQGGGRTFSRPRWLRMLFGTKPRLTRVYPAPRHNKIDEYDLFEGVEPDQVMVEPVE